MKINSFIPSGKIPENGPQLHYVDTRNQEVYWLGYDCYSLYKKNGGHAIYGEYDITYKMNSLGYRCPEFDQKADLCVLSLGCSFAIGKGVKLNEIYSEIVCQRLREQLGVSVVNYNLGSGGASNNFISRTLHLALPVLNPDLVLVNFTFPQRREYVTRCGELIKYARAHPLNWFEGVARTVHKYLRKLDSSPDDHLNLFNNYKSVSAALALRPWVATFVEEQYANYITDHLEPKTFAGNFVMYDTARDGGHPGPISHQAVADLCWQNLINQGLINKFKKQYQSTPDPKVYVPQENILMGLL